MHGNVTEVAIQVSSKLLFPILEEVLCASDIKAYFRLRVWTCSRDDQIPVSSDLSHYALWLLLISKKATVAQACRSN